MKILCVVLRPTEVQDDDRDLGDVKVKNSKTQIMMKIKSSKCDKNLKTKTVIKNKNSNCYKIQKLKL